MVLVWVEACLPKRIEPPQELEMIQFISGVLLLSAGLDTRREGVAE